MSMKDDAREALDLLDDDLDNAETGLMSQPTGDIAAVTAVRVLIAAARLGSRIFRTINEHEVED